MSEPSKPVPAPPLAASPGSARQHDVNLCDPCMDALGVNKQRAWMGHTSDDGGVECDMCGSMVARLCFRVVHGTRTGLPYAERYVIGEDGSMRVEMGSPNAVVSDGGTPFAPRPGSENPKQGNP